MTREQLRAELASMPERDDLAGNWTERQKREHEQRRWRLGRWEPALRRADLAIAELDPKIAFDTTWLEHLKTWRKTLVQRLFAMPKKDREVPQGKAWGLELSIERIDRGLSFRGQLLPGRIPLDVLMAEAGFVPANAQARANDDAWHGSMDEVELRLKDLKRRRAEAQKTLDQFAALPAATETVTT